MKLVNDIIVKYKGKDKVNETKCGKSAFSKQGFDELFHAVVNDTTYKVTTIDKEGKEIQKNLSTPVRESVKKSFANGKYPQKSEISVFDTSEINTTDWVEAFKEAMDIWMGFGRKFDLPSKKDRNGSIYFTKIPPKEKTMNIHDINSKENLGTTTITTEEYIQIRAKSPVPKHLQKKVRRDKTGKIVTK
jgi:hypothetical protein